MYQFQQHPKVRWPCSPTDSNSTMLETLTGSPLHTCQAVVTLLYTQQLVYMPLHRYLPATWWRNLRWLKWQMSWPSSLTRLNISSGSSNTSLFDRWWAGPEWETARAAPVTDSGTSNGGAITAHHSYAFLKSREGSQSGGSSHLKSKWRCSTSLATFYLPRWGKLWLHEPESQRRLYAITMCLRLWT